MTDRAILEKAAKAITLMLEDMGLQTVGFALVFDFGSGGYLAWVSNARADMLKVIQEFIDKNGGVGIFAH